MFVFLDYVLLVQFYSTNPLIPSGDNHHTGKVLVV